MHDGRQGNAGTEHERARDYRAESRTRGAPPLRMADAVRFSWAFGQGGPAFERSPFGGMLDRADMLYGPEGVEGNGGVILSRGSFAADQRRQWREKQRERIENEETTKALLEFGPEITARITAESVPAPAIPDNDSDLERMAEVTSGLRAMIGRGIEDAHAIAAAMYDDRGSEWARHGFEYGGLYHLTETGRKLIRRVREETRKDKPANLQLSDAELLANDLGRAEMFATPENHARREALQKVHAEAFAKFKGFAAAWNYARYETVSGVAR